METPLSTGPEAAVYDPSFRRSDTSSYWQWTNVEVDDVWERVAEFVNMGWPTRPAIDDQNGRLYGVVLTRKGECWIYRVFPAGKDRFGREGRYFFVLVRLESTEGIPASSLAGLFQYFTVEKSLPLKTEGLCNGWDDAKPDATLLAMLEAIENRLAEGHLGMGDESGIVRFSEIDPTLDPGPPEGHGSSPSLGGSGIRPLLTGVVVAVVGLAAVHLNGKYSNSVSRPEEGERCKSPAPSVPQAPRHPVALAEDTTPDARLGTDGSEQNIEPESKTFPNPDADAYGVRESRDDAMRPDAHSAVPSSREAQNPRRIRPATMPNIDCVLYH